MDDVRMVRQREKTYIWSNKLGHIWQTRLELGPDYWLRFYQWAHYDCHVSNKKVWNYNGLINSKYQYDYIESIFFFNFAESWNEFLWILMHEFLYNNRCVYQTVHRNGRYIISITHSLAVRRSLAGQTILIPFD